MAKFEKRFEGRDNAGLRAKIRAIVYEKSCGPLNEQAVLSLRRTVALTASGEATLRQVALDYRRAGGELSRTCDCDACYAGNLQALGALG